MNFYSKELFLDQFTPVSIYEKIKEIFVNISELTIEEGGEETVLYLVGLNEKNEEHEIEKIVHSALGGAFCRPLELAYGKVRP